jgi:hypothetical protein
MNSSDRWFVRFRGHTLGPLSTEQILLSIQKKEIGAADKIALASNPVWQEIQSQKSFQSLFPKTSFDSLPSPSQVLYRKKKVEIPKYLPPAKNEPSEKTFDDVKEFLPKPESSLKFEKIRKPLPIQAKEKNSRKKTLKKGKKKPLAAVVGLKKRILSTKVDRKKTVDPIPASPSPIEKSPMAEMAASEPPVKEFPVIQSPIESPIQEISKSAEKLPLQQEIRSEKSEITVSKILQSFPERPEIQQSFENKQQEMLETFSFLDSLRDWSKNEAAIKSEKNYTKNELVTPAPLANRELEIKLTLTRPWIAAMGFVVICIFGALLFWSFETNKKRDLKDFHPSDPSSPTIQPSKQDDPTPGLKAPTRPKRD